MKSFKVDVAALHAVAAAVLDRSGVLKLANPGFLRLLPLADPIGSKVGRYFIQPNFASLGAKIDGAPEGEFHGLLTIGDQAGKVRTLRGRVWRDAAGIRVLAENDIEKLEKLTDSMLGLNRDSTQAQHSLAEANVGFKQREVQIIAASLTDALTGVGNRRMLEQSLAAEINRAARSGFALCLIMADADHFKRVNDTFGHGVGDKVLVHLGAVLKSSVRPTDIVARFGGEEFMVLLPQSINLAQAAQKAEQFRMAISAGPIAPMTEPTTCSFGVAQFQPGESSDSLLRRVDAALYRAKEGGRNRVVADGVTDPPRPAAPLPCDAVAAGAAAAVPQPKRPVM